MHIRREIEIMTSLAHPHIISIYEGTDSLALLSLRNTAAINYYSWPGCVSVFENKEKIVIVMEYASKGDLYDYLCEKQRIAESQARHFFRQIVSAVHYCHRVTILSTLFCTTQPLKVIAHRVQNGRTLKKLIRPHVVSITCAHCLRNFRPSKLVFLHFRMILACCYHDYQVTSMLITCF